MSEKGDSGWGLEFSVAAFLLLDLESVCLRFFVGDAASCFLCLRLRSTSLAVTGELSMSIASEAIMGAIELLRAVENDRGRSFIFFLI